MKADPFIIGLTGLAGAGKDTAGEHLVLHHAFVRWAFAEPIRNMLESLIQDGDFDYAYLFERKLKEQSVPGLGISARRLMQTLGTEWGRGLDPELWIRIAERALGIPQAPVHDRIVITDVRFPNEADWIRRHGGIVVRIERRLSVVQAHISEQHVAQINVFDSISNDGTCASLHSRIDDLIERLESPESPK